MRRAFALLAMLVFLPSLALADTTEAPASTVTEGATEPEPTPASQCNLHSDSAPDGCLCIAEDTLLDATSELKACRKRPESFDYNSMTWIERVIWLTATALAALLI